MTDILNQFRSMDLYNAVWNELLGAKGFDVRAGSMKFQGGTIDTWVSSTGSRYDVVEEPNQVTVSVSFYEHWNTWGEIFLTIIQPSGARLFPTITTNGLVNNSFKFVFKKVDGTNENVSNVPNLTYVNFIVLGKANPIQGNETE